MNPFSDLWRGIKDFWGGLTASPSDLNKIDKALGNDYNPIKDAGNAAKQAAGDVTGKAAENFFSGNMTLVVIVGFILALVVFDN